MKKNPSFREHLDLSSFLIITVTVVLFIAACYLKGLTHEILLEAAVFLVSVKLIQLSYKGSVSSARLEAKLDEILSHLKRNSKN